MRVKGKMLKRIIALEISVYQSGHTVSDHRQQDVQYIDGLLASVIDDNLLIACLQTYLNYIKTGIIIAGKVIFATGNSALKQAILRALQAHQYYVGAQQSQQKLLQANKNIQEIDKQYQAIIRRYEEKINQFKHILASRQDFATVQYIQQLDSHIQHSNTMLEQANSDNKKLQLKVHEVNSRLAGCVLKIMKASKNSLNNDSKMITDMVFYIIKNMVVPLGVRYFELFDFICFCKNKYWKNILRQFFLRHPDLFSQLLCKLLANADFDVAGLDSPYISLAWRYYHWYIIAVSNESMCDASHSVKIFQSALKFCITNYEREKPYAEKLIWYSRVKDIIFMIKAKKHGKFAKYAILIHDSWLAKVARRSASRVNALLLTHSLESLHADEIVITDNIDNIAVSTIYIKKLFLIESIRIHSLQALYFNRYCYHRLKLQFFIAKCILARELSKANVFISSNECLVSRGLIDRIFHCLNAAYHYLRCEHNVVFSFDDYYVILQAVVFLAKDHRLCSDIVHQALRAFFNAINSNFHEMGNFFKLLEFLCANAKNYDIEQLNKLTVLIAHVAELIKFIAHPRCSIDSVEAMANALDWMLSKVNFNFECPRDISVCYKLASELGFAESENFHTLPRQQRLQLASVLFAAVPKRLPGIRGIFSTTLAQYYLAQYKLACIWSDLGKDKQLVINALNHACSAPDSLCCDINPTKQLKTIAVEFCKSFFTNSGSQSSLSGNLTS